MGRPEIGRLQRAVHGVQDEGAALILRQCKRDGHLVCIDGIEQLGKARARQATAVQMPHHHAGLLIWAGVGKAQAGRDRVGMAQPKQQAALPDAQQVQKRVAREGDVSGCGLDRRVGQQRAQRGPEVGVAFLGRQAAAPVVVGGGPVQAVEPVAAVKAVAVAAFAAQQFNPGVEVGNALAEGGQRQSQHLDTCAVFAAGGQRQLEHVDVKQRLVVVVFDVVHHFAGLAGETGALAGVVDVCQALGAAVGGGHGIAAQGAGQPHAHHVGGALQVGGAGLGVWIGVVEQAIEPALALLGLRGVVAAATAAGGVAAAVAEGANAAAVQAELAGLHKARAVGDLAKVPAFAQQVDVAAAGAVDGRLQPLHGLARLVAHQVKTKAVDAVVACPDHGAVDHQLGHHAVFGGRVVTAGAGLDGALGVEALVVTGHDAVQHRLRLLTAGAGVVVDHVHAHAQARRMQGLHHAPKLQHAGGAVFGVAGKTALGRGEVQRVVAPVVAIAARKGRHGGLLGFTVGAGLRQRAGVGAGAAAFGHAGQVKHGQQVHVGQASLRQRLQVLHAAAVGFGEGQVLAAVGRADAGVADGEVAHVQFVDHQVGGRWHTFWCGLLVPAGWAQGRRVQTADPGAARVGVQAQRIGVGDAVAHPSNPPHKHIDQVGVGVAAEVARRTGGPGPGAVVAPQRQQPAGLLAGGLVQAQPDALRGGCPQLEAGALSGGFGAQVRQALGLGVQVVQQPGLLQRRSAQHAPLLVFLHQHPLAGQPVGQPGLVCGSQRQRGATGDPLETLLQRVGQGSGVRHQRDGAVKALRHLTGRRADLTGCGMQKAKPPRWLGVGPTNEPAAQPDRLGLGRQCRWGGGLQDGFKVRLAGRQSGVGQGGLGGLSGCRRPSCAGGGCRDQNGQRRDGDSPAVPRGAGSAATGQARRQRRPGLAQVSVRHLRSRWAWLK